MNILKEYHKGNLKEIYAFNKAIKSLPEVNLQWSNRNESFDWSKEMHYKEVEVILDILKKANLYNPHKSIDNYLPGSDTYNEIMAIEKTRKTNSELVEKYKIGEMQVIDEAYYSHPTRYTRSGNLWIYKFTFTIKIEKYRDVEDSDSYDEYGEYLGCDQESYMDDQTFYFYSTDNVVVKMSSIIKEPLSNYCLPYDVPYKDKENSDRDNNPIGHMINNYARNQEELILRTVAENMGCKFKVLKEIFGDSTFSKNSNLKYYPWESYGWGFDDSFIKSIYTEKNHYLNYGPDSIENLVKEYTEWLSKPRKYVFNDEIIEIKSRRYWRDFGSECRSYVQFKALNLKEYEPVKEQS